MAARGIWKGSISFGLLNIPVVLHTAEEGRELHFRLLDKRNMRPVKYKKVNSQTGEEVPYENIVKGFEFEPGHYVTFTPEDLKAVNPKATQTIDVKDFVPIEEIDTMLFERPYYLVPQKSGVKGYELFRDALAHSKKVAIGTIVIRTKQHLAAIIPRDQYLILELLRFAHEIKEVQEAEYFEGSKKPTYSNRELQMAEALIEGMTSEWDPRQYKDTYYDEVMKAIERKVKTGKVTRISEAEERVEPTTGVVDLVPLLKKSLAEKTRPHKGPPPHGRGKGKARHKGSQRQHA